jgi:uncharacterized membrane protein YfcA
MSALVLAALYAIGLGTGWLVGAIGVGGVLLVPALVLIGGLGVEAATPVASLSFLFTGLAGTATYAAHGRLPRDAVLWLTVGAAPAAVAGAATNIAIPARAITIAIAAVLAAAAARSLSGRRLPSSTEGRGLSGPAYVAVGAVVGFASALTGTGGPVLLIPILMLAGGAAMTAVAASQPIQIPIAVAATAAFIAFGSIDWRLGIGLGVVQAAGSVAGARFSHGLPAHRIQQLVSLALIAATAIFIGKALPT